MNILDKIIKLRSLATSNNLNEASAAAAVANKLILQHQISETQLNLHQSTNTDRIVSDPEPFYSSARTTTWKLELALLLGKHYGCAIWNAKKEVDGKTHSEYRLIGREEDNRIVRYMFTWFVGEIQSLCDLECKGAGLNYRDSYCRGAVKGIANLLEYTRNKAIVEAREKGRDTALAVIQGRQQQACDYLLKTHRAVQPVVKTGLNLDAFEKGRDRGAHVAKEATQPGYQALPARSK